MFTMPNCRTSGCLFVYPPASVGIRFCRNVSTGGSAVPGELHAADERTTTDTSEATSTRMVTSPFSKHNRNVTGGYHGGGGACQGLSTGVSMRGTGTPGH
jgi:hypothetical protein